MEIIVGIIGNDFIFIKPTTEVFSYLGHSIVIYVVIQVYEG